MTLQFRRAFLKRGAAFGAFFAITPLANAQKSMQYVCASKSRSRSGDSLEVNFHTKNGATATWIFRTSVMPEALSPSSPLTTPSKVILTFEFSQGEAFGTSIVPGWSIINAKVQLHREASKTEPYTPYKLRMSMGNRSNPYLDKTADSVPFKNSAGDVLSSEVTVSTASINSEETESFVSDKDREARRELAGKMLSDALSTADGKSLRPVLLKDPITNIPMAIVPLKSTQSGATLANNFNQLQTKNLEKLEKGECRESACFLTTATVDALGLNDDCWELETLRRFRDDILLPDINGRTLVDEYYRVAPKIVADISLQHNSNHIWKRTYARYILPSALMAKLGLNRATERHYAKMVRSLQLVTA